MTSPATKQWCEVSREVMDAIAREDWTEVRKILSENSRHVADYVFSQLRSEHMSSAVMQVIECLRDEDRAQTMRVLNNILHSIAVRDSTCTRGSLNDRFLHATAQPLPVLPVSDLELEDDRLDSVLLAIAVEQRQWRAVGEVLVRGVSDSLKQWAVREACKHCQYEDTRTSLRSLHSLSYLWLNSPVDQFLVCDILPHCADDQLDFVLATLVERCLWQAVLYVLKRGVSDSSKRRVVLEVCACCKSVVQRHIPSEILLFCAEDQADCVLTTLVEVRQWWAVGEMLKKGVSDSNKQWAVREACANCNTYHFATFDSPSSLPDPTFIEYALLMEQFLVHNILPHCADDQVLTTLVERRLWQAVGVVLERGVSEKQGRWAMEEVKKAVNSADFLNYVMHHCCFSLLDSLMPFLVFEGEFKVVDTVMRTHSLTLGKAFYLPRWYIDVVPFFVKHRLWNNVIQILNSVVLNSLCYWVKQKGENKEADSVLWEMVNSCRVNATDAVQFFKMAKEDTAKYVNKLHKLSGLTADLCELFYTSLLDQVCVSLCSYGKQTEMVSEPIKSYVHLIYSKLLVHMETISTNTAEGIISQLRSAELETSMALTVLHKFSSSSVQLFLYVLLLSNLYYAQRRSDADDEYFLIVLSVLPLSPELQSVALRIMLRHKRWDVISHADLSGVWEQDRRHLLQAAVKQRQWSVVKRWSDHTLYDDQRVWALNEALNEKQWDVALLLADHGLTDIDLMRVHYRLAKYADWDVILHMFERGADVEEVKERLGRMKDNKRISEESQLYINDRHSQVKTLDKTIQNPKEDTWENACRRCNWMFVLYALLRNPSPECILYALKMAMKKKAWHVAMQLVRLGMDAKQRHSLFSWMIKRRQWGVCKVLLEQGLSVHLCLKVLPKLMDMNQWALVARVMEHDVSDDVRQQVMQRAWERREGSVVWLCIKSLPAPLSVEEREALFQRAFTCEMWQVIKPLVEEKDETGIRHRDTALLEAIDQHQWDLVDYCQWHHADINMKDDEGHTPLQRAAMKKDWEAVEELVVRDGNLNLLDSKGYTVLHRVLRVKQWSIVKLLIEYQADIHKEQQSVNGEPGVTPLGMLIDARRVDIIDHSLLWCPDQSKGVNDVGETALHVACLSGYYDSMYNLVARGANPLAVTETGQSALVYAVLNADCPQRMVAECIRLGFSTHQPKLTNIESLKCLNPYYTRGRITFYSNYRITSPFLCALLLRSLPVVVEMLYKSGACSQRELFRLYTQLLKLTDLNTVEGRKLLERAGHDVVAYQNFLDCIKNIALPYLTGIATTPRSLVSTCRLVISHCLTLSKTRHRDVDQLPLTERMKNFVLFSDLTEPDFGKDTT